MRFQENGGNGAQRYKESRESGQTMIRPRRSAAITVSEPTLNVLLASLLERKGLRQAVGEVVSQSGAFRPDIWMRVGGIRVILEGKFAASGVEARLETQCRERLEKGYCPIAVGVVYPALPPRLMPTYTTGELEEYLLSALYRLKVFYLTGKGIGEIGWEEAVSFAGLVDLLRNVHAQVVQDDWVQEAVFVIGEGLDGFASSLEDVGEEPSALADRLRQALALPKEAPGAEKAENEE